MVQPDLVSGLKVAYSYWELWKDTQTQRGIYEELLPHDPAEFMLKPGFNFKGVGQKRQEAEEVSSCQCLSNLG